LACGAPGEATRWARSPKTIKRGKFFESAESSIMKVNTYLQLSQRTGEMSVEAGQCGLALVERVALLVRGLVEHT
jgi:hypothetical protein